MDQRLDRDRVRELFDLRGPAMVMMGGAYEQDPYPVWKELREQSAVHAGTLHELTGFPGEYHFHGLPEPHRQHFTVFGYRACNDAFRNGVVFASGPGEVDFAKPPSLMNSMLAMDGDRHRRYRALVQPRFVPDEVQWWLKKSIEHTVELLVQNLLEQDGRAELNVDFCAAIPVLTITSAFGIPVSQALEVRANTQNTQAMLDIIAPLVAARRQRPQDDLLSVLVAAELVEPDGTTVSLSDAEIYSFALLLLAAGSGTTWKQMGILLTTLLHRPDVLQAVREDRRLLMPVIEETLRFEPTDPMFSRWVTQDIDFHGTHLPKGAVVHLCLGSANRDPARWDHPDEWDPRRPPKASLAFGGGPHTCLGMHVARAELITGINALLDRLPHLRLDTHAEPPRIIGFYERGATAIPVAFG